MDSASKFTPIDYRTYLGLPLAPPENVPPCRVPNFKKVLSPKPECTPTKAAPSQSVHLDLSGRPNICGQNLRSTKDSFVGCFRSCTTEMRPEVAKFVLPIVEFLCVASGMTALFLALMGTLFMSPLTFGITIGCLIGVCTALFIYLVRFTNSGD
jgi:hypothetical protein